jgi:hypothetical protein
MVLITVPECIFVYIDIATAENNLAFSGISMLAKSSITVYEFLM